MNIGDELPLSDKQLEKITQLFSDHEHLKDAIEEMSLRAGRKKDEAWNLVKEWLPESKGYNMHYTNEDGRARVIVRDIPEKREGE